MMSAFECLLKAAHCRELARRFADPINRDMMLETAQSWQKLGEKYKVAECDVALAAIDGEISEQSDVT